MREAEERLAEISASISRYYDLISEEERAEILAWADFVAANLGDWPSDGLAPVDSKD